jgi:alkanesulfonate monooxygenase SsuD/methylene tetrahydromethanopterin reductase-like flavin-dependent oxidoreductase (luciferase family)
VVLPTARENGADALALATRAELAGVDAVMAFDHLWPVGERERPSLAPFPVLAAVAARSEVLFVGPLVARVGLFSTAHLVGEFRALSRVAPGRVIAALGTGDKTSFDEEAAYGLAARTPSERRARLDEALGALAGHAELWCGAGGEETNATARRHRAALNLWRASPGTVREAAADGPVTWAGPLEGGEALLDALERAGATWAVATRAGDLDALESWRARR